MERTYSVVGMHCENCIPKVKEGLSNIAAIESSILSLNPPQAKLKLRNDISVQLINNELSKIGKFSFSE
ncbi:MAG: heavy-metal-associated domain-containing protein [Ignavibacteria bacterium]|jgi:copper chaperone CopZ|nr:heavy-metal-associated domain-containing protein [Ignavibacteria bacterium]